MTFFDFLTMLGGLAFFLYGMDMLSDALTAISGSKLKTIMTDLTSNKLKAVLLGAGVTALIQSSSATTVIVVSLVNSGVMTLSQAVGVIMGANIGTTMTAWILSLASLSSSNFFVQMLNPKSFSPILAIVGVFMLMSKPSEKKVEISKLMIGFAILMFGMNTMSGAVKPLANSPFFAHLMTLFSNPILGIMVGAIITAVIQSSSASVGILQSVSTTGLVTFGTAMPIIFGQNIGTCATAMISAIGAKPNGKRTAIIHLMFNLIGTIIFSILFYTINAVRPFAFMAGPINAMGIAAVHTTFNLFATALLLPHSERLVKLAYQILPIKEEERDEDIEPLQSLDDRLLDTPSIALAQSHELTLQMFEIARKGLAIAITLLTNFDKGGFEKVERYEDKVNAYQDRLGKYLADLSARSFVDDDSQKLNILIQSLDDIERISDHAVNIAKAASAANEEGYAFSQQAKGELAVYTQAVLDLVEKAYKVLETLDEDQAFLIEPFEEVIDELSDKMQRRHIKRVRKNQCSIEMGFVLSELINNLERIADHCSNIGVAVITTKNDTFETHSYLETLLKEDASFQKEFKSKRAEYALPKQESKLETESTCEA